MEPISLPPSPVVLITGCSTGIGRATATYLAGRGWRVFASARRLDSIADLASNSITPLHLDVTDEANCVAVVSEVLGRAGRIDALVNNAGYAAIGALEDVPSPDVRVQFETNLFGGLRLAQLVIPTMRTQRAGRIVNAGSILGRIPLPASGLYSASKAALRALTDVMRLELRPWNIKVILVESGTVSTSFAEHALAHARRFSDNPDSPYAPMYKSAERYMGATHIPGVPGPDLVARVIHRALTARNPKPHYDGTPGTLWSLLPRIMPLVPGRMRDRLIARAFNIK